MAESEMDETEKRAEEEQEQQQEERVDSNSFDSPHLFAQPEAISSHETALPRVQRNGKLYRKKKANLPFLKRHTWEDTKISTTTTTTTTTTDKKSTSSSSNKMEKESSPPPIYERTTQVSRTLFRYTAVIVLGTLLLSRAMTETWTFGYKGKWTNVMNWMPRPMKTFTESELLLYNGEDPSLPIYLAIDETVYDVSANPRMYGKGASYNHFAGRDGARAFVTGCFQTHLTHDTRGFSDKEQKALDGWKSFFDNHAKYYKVGKVLHEPIPEDAPLPEPCDAKSEGGAR